MADFYIKQGDRLPVITSVLKSGDGTPIDLTDCTVTFHMCKAYDGAVVTDALATIVGPAASGSVSYSWTLTDTALPGSYYAEWMVTYPGGQEERFPNTDNIIIEVLRAVVA